DVAVPGDAEVGTVLAHRVDGGLAVLRQQRVGDAVGEAAVRLVVDAHELQRQVRGQQVDDGAGAAVAGVDHQLQRLERGHVHVGQQVFDVGGLVGARGLAGGRR